MIFSFKSIFTRIIKRIMISTSILWPSMIYLEILFKLVMNKKLDLQNPETFNEKIQWLKLYDQNPFYSTLVDKYEVKKYVGSIIGDEYIIPTLGIWNKFDEIDFSSLPNQFVLKCTHDSGGIVICRNKDVFNYNKAKKKIGKSLKRNYYYLYREWPYNNVKPRIIAEKYLSENQKTCLQDYKFFCFNGKPEFLYVSRGLDNHSTAQISFYDLKGNLLNFKRNDYNPINNITFPNNLNKMIEIAKKLALFSKSPFIRIDLYSIQDQIFFSEFTFSPCGGLLPLVPSNVDSLIGKMLNIKETNSENNNDSQS